MTEPGLAATTSGAMAAHVHHVYGPAQIEFVQRAIRLAVQQHPNRLLDCTCAAYAALGALQIYQRNHQEGPTPG